VAKAIRMRPPKSRRKITPNIAPSRRPSSLERLAKGFFDFFSWSAIGAFINSSGPYYLTTCE
jgi:hypothetical protein